MTKKTPPAITDSKAPGNKPNVNTIDAKALQAEDKQAEFGGRKGPEPTRYGDWEKNGLISDF